MQVSALPKEPGFSHEVCQAMTHLPEASWCFRSRAGYIGVVGWGLEGAWAPWHPARWPPRSVGRQPVEAPACRDLAWPNGPMQTGQWEGFGALSGKENRPVGGWVCQLGEVPPCGKRVWAAR